MESGPPCSYPDGNQGVLYRVGQRPQHSTRDTRVNTVGSLLAGFGRPGNPTPLAQGHDLAQFDPNHAPAALTYGVTVPNRVRAIIGGGQNQQQQQGPSPGIMLNGINSCFAAAAISFVNGIEVINSLLIMISH